MWVCSKRLVFPQHRLLQGLDLKASHDIPGRGKKEKWRGNGHLERVCDFPTVPQKGNSSCYQVTKCLAFLLDCVFT